LLQLSIANNRTTASNTMQFLLDLRLPFLDAYLAGPTQSLLAEALFWTIIVLIYSSIAPRIIRPVARKMKYWKLAKQRGGIFCGNGQDDSIVLFLWGLHHFVAGAMMAYGVVTHDNSMWRHGYLLETGFEVSDSISVIASLYPYKLDGMKSDIKAALIFHHATGTLLAYPILNSILAANEHMQAITMWLLLGAAVSCVVACFVYTRNFDSEMPLVTTAFLFNVVFFLYCRFYQFPLHSWHLIQDVKAAEEGAFGGIEVSTLLKFLYGGLIAMTLFNLGIITDLVPKSVRYVRRALDGVTPIEAEPVPRSRDSIFSRRASVQLIQKSSRRGSTLFAAVMHLTAVDDIAATTSNTPATSNGADDSDLHEDDMQALHQTVAQLNGKTKVA
jgi:hypothetical protein